MDGERRRKKKKEKEFGKPEQYRPRAKLLFMLFSGLSVSTINLSQKKHPQNDL
jgi:hypothetical protein